MASEPRRGVHPQRHLRKMDDGRPRMLVAQKRAVPGSRDTFPGAGIAGGVQAGSSRLASP